jgi:hypothetical protein
MNGEYQNNIDELPSLNEYKYENLFRVHNLDGYYVYNIANSLIFDKELDRTYYYEWTVDKPLPWTIISHIHYNTIDLWWLICILNNIQNPIKFPETGTRLKVFKPSYVRIIIDQIISKIEK